MFNRLLHWLNHIHDYTIIDKGELTSRGIVIGNWYDVKCGHIKKVET